MINRIMRASGGTRGLVWTAAACITVSLLVMFFISVAGPSIVVPTMAHAPDGAPPWWISLGLGRPLTLFLSWGAAVLGAIGVGAGLIAVSRGARVPVRPLLAVSFIVIAIFTFLPAAGTTDTQSYAIDGNMIVLHHSPYVFTPATMVTLGDKLAVGSPPTWAHQLSDYGPIASAEEWVSAELGGTSMALITFWLKLFVALAFGAVVLLLDRLLRDNPAMRLRAHLLWSLNPLLLWEIVASGHIDGLAIAFGIAGLALLRFAPGRRQADAGPVRGGGHPARGRRLHQVTVRALPGRRPVGGAALARQDRLPARRLAVADRRLLRDRRLARGQGAVPARPAGHLGQPLPGDLPAVRHRPDRSARTTSPAGSSRWRWCCSSASPRSPSSGCPTGFPGFRR